MAFVKEADRMTSKKSIVALRKGILSVAWVPWPIFSMSWCWSSDLCAAEWYDAGRKESLVEKYCSSRLLVLVAASMVVAV